MPSDYQPAVFITGASRGVGLALTETYASRQWTVIATCRDPGSATDLNALAERHENISIDQLDVVDQAAVRQLAERYDGKSIDVLLNNAACLGAGEQQSADCVDVDLFQEVMMTNTYAPMFLASEFLDHVARSEHKKIVTLTSGLSSIAMTEGMGQFYFYRASKAAINIAMRAMQADVKERGITVAVVAPGLVNTDLLTASGYRGPSIEPAEAAERLFDYIADLKPNTAEGFAVPPDRMLPW